MMKKFAQPNNRGFTLLLSILVGVVILTIGTTILNSTLKQFVLSEISVESERAFHAAYAGVECAQYWNTGDYWDVGTGTYSIRCMGQDVTTSDPTLTSNASDMFTAEFDWSTIGTGYSYEMCTRITVHKYAPSGGDINMSDDVLNGVLPGSLDTDQKTCFDGTECTVVESRGYNRSCGSLGGIRTVEREVTVRF